MIPVKGPPLDIGGGPGVFAWPFLFISQGRWDGLFVHLRIGCISTMPCGHLFIAIIFPQKYLFLKDSTHTNGGLLTGRMLLVDLWVFTWQLKVERFIAI